MALDSNHVAMSPVLFKNNGKRDNSMASRTPLTTRAIGTSFDKSNKS